MARKPVKRPRTPKPPPSPWQLISDQFKPFRGLAITITAIGGAFVFLWSGVVKLGWDPATSSTINEVKVEITKKITDSDEALRQKLVLHVEGELIQVRKELSEIRQDITQRKRDLWRFQIDNLSAQEAQITWSQLPQINTNIAGIERQLQERPTDTWLAQRKSEVENAKKNIESRLAEIRANLKTLRDTPP